MTDKTIRATAEKSAVRKQIEAAKVKYVEDAAKNLLSSESFHAYATTALSLLPSLLAEHDQAIESLKAKLDAAKDTLQFVERWANHHGANCDRNIDAAIASTKPGSKA